MVEEGDGLTTIGHRRIICFPTVTATRLRFTILDSKACPLITRVSIYNAPEFNADGTYKVRPYVTVIQNGVVLQNHTEILGTTEYIGFPQVKVHGDGPILLQNHGDPSPSISFRNIWIRKM